jgi:hypothetical protein
MRGIASPFSSALLDERERDRGVGKFIIISYHSWKEYSRSLEEVLVLNKLGTFNS